MAGWPIVALTILYMQDHHGSVRLVVRETAPETPYLLIRMDNAGDEDQWEFIFFEPQAPPPEMFEPPTACRESSRKQLPNWHKLFFLLLVLLNLSYAATIYKFKGGRGWWICSHIPGVHEDDKVCAAVVCLHCCAGCCTKAPCSSPPKYLSPLCLR